MTAFALAQKMAGIYSNHSRLNCDDLASAAVLGLLQAKCVNAGPLANSIIHRRLVDVERRERGDRLQRHHDVSLDLVLGVSVNPWDAVERRIALHQIQRRLEPRARAIVHAYYYEGKTLAEVGRQFGFRQTRANQIVKQALQTMREAA